MPTYPVFQHAYVVSDLERCDLKGVVTLREFLRAADDQLISDVMRTEVSTLDPLQSAFEDALRTLGLAEAALGVDAENVSGALRVYEAMGFRRARTAANYRKAFTVD